MKKLLTLAMALGLIAQSIPVNATNVTSVYNTETDTTDENTEGKVKYQLNENEYFYYADDSLDLSNVESFNTSLYGVVTYQKTITIKSEEQYFPDTMDYEEYKNGFWYTGTLYLQDILKVSGGWKATYTGYLYLTNK